MNMKPNDIVRYFKNHLSAASQPCLLDSSYDNVVLQTNNQIIRTSLNKSYEDVKQEFALLQFLYNNGIKVPKPLDVEELAINDILQPIATLTTAYVECTPNTPINDTLVRQAATELYRIHQIGEKFCQTTHFTQTRRLGEHLNQLSRNLQAGMSNKAINREAILNDTQWALEFLKNNTSNTDTPRTVLHNDFRPQNILRNETGLVAVIDFDYSIPTQTPQKDVAHAALEWSFPDTAQEPNMHIFKLFINTYAKLTGMTYEQYIQKNQLYNWVKVSAMIDAAGYYLQYPENTEERFSSYMYKKYRYFQIFDHT